MDYKVDFQESFLEDLEQIVRTLAAENSAAAQKLGELVVNASEALAFFPERHPRVRRVWSCGGSSSRGDIRYLIEYDLRRR